MQWCAGKPALGSEMENPWFLAFTNFSGVNTLNMASFRPLIAYKIHECPTVDGHKPVQARPSMSLYMHVI